ncbi:nitroreductase family protein [Candidatus Bipolaricaulota bacterium]|nr:nitroreductase family protein [Candidatus Bipolaricaulota bacterium]
MDDVLQVIMKRRSVRKFTGEPVPREKIITALKAAMAAPSGMNRQPWSFVVVTNKETVAALCQAHGHAAFGVNAGAVILPFGKKVGEKWFDQDMAAATENLLIALANLGLGATWCGMDDSRQGAIRPLVGLPKDQFVFALIPVGIPAEEKAPRTQYDTKRIHWEAYRPGD